MSRQVKLWLDVLNGFPSIVIGIFVFELLVVAKLPVIGIGHHQSAWAGGFALSIIMLPLVSRTTMEVLALVPNNLREASYALGVSKWRTVLGVVLPSAIGGIVTGTTLAVARAAGETAPLLFVCSIFGQVGELGPVELGRVGAGGHLRVLRAARPQPQRPGLGGGVRADRLRARHEPGCAVDARAGRKLDTDAVHQLVTIVTTSQPILGHVLAWSGPRTRRETS